MRTEWDVGVILYEDVEDGGEFWEFEEEWEEVWVEKDEDCEPELFCINDIVQFIFVYNGYNVCLHLTFPRGIWKLYKYL